MGLFGKLFGKNDDFLNNSDVPIPTPGKAPAPAPQAPSSAAETTPTAASSPTPAPDSGTAYMDIDDVFHIVGRGTVATGRIENGPISVGDMITIQTSTGTIRTHVLGVEAFRKTLQTAEPGTNAGLLLENVTRDEISRGDRITK